ncbi:hypothetical protein FMM05_08565 [Flavobacterium zepuense]|uniref:Uncharacterized protein n=1 Tax=Flavobacterium zepuense TaxID=2593302 RepID=A0A552V4D5_9FLAO|nr:hypothetical protein [Flavobacterium zepuense]TRW25346.1 hypothetical protein FMM05_08565 [Flavobacterium zepuense]
MKKQIGLMPFLRGHISIPPHENVTTSEHYYSYSKAGTNIAWHSGEKINGDYRLSTQLDNIFQLAYNNKDISTTKQQFSEFINEFYESNNLKFTRENTDYQILEFSNY